MKDEQGLQAQERDINTSPTENVNPYERRIGENSSRESPLAPLVDSEVEPTTSVMFTNTEVSVPPSVEPELSREPAVVASATPLSTVPQKKHRSKTMLVAGLLVLLLAFGVGVWALQYFL